jgi:O-antigen ligase
MNPSVSPIWTNAIAVESVPSATAPRRVYRFTLTSYLFQVLLCAVPAAGLLASGRASLAGYYFWGMFGLVLLITALRGRCDEMLALLISLAPFINLLRSFAFYNVIVTLFGGAGLYYFVLSSGTCARACKRFPLLVGMFVCIAIYYALSVFNTAEYFANLRLFELVFTIFFVLLLSRTPALLGAALIGLIVCAWGVGISMLPHLGSGSRLGIISLNGYTLGNPTQLGIPLAFGFLALIVDRGRWLRLDSKPAWRWLMLAVTLPLLALTTSRSSWLVAAGGVFLCTLIDGKQRLKMLMIVAIAAIAVQAVLISPFGLSLKKGIERTFGEEKSVSHRTSGRSDQWKVASYVFTRSFENFLFGYGAGRSPQVYAAYSAEVPGVKYAIGKKVAFHSLFMQIAVDVGLIGLLLLTIGLAIAFFKIAFRLSSQRSIFPLICFLAYVFIVITVSGNDINSGIFLGIALLGTVPNGG